MSAVQHAADARQELADDQARAERVAIMRRRRAALQNFGIRMVSLAIFLAIWQVAASCGPDCGRACWCC